MTAELKNMINKKQYDSVLVFESAIIIGGTRVYGLLYESTRFPLRSNREYMEYVAGARKWLDNGNRIDEEGNFVDKEGEIIYKDRSSLMREYCKQAFEERPIGYFFKEGLTFDYSEDDVDGGFIINERVWDWAIGQIDELYDCGEDVCLEQDVKDCVVENSSNDGDDDDLEGYAWEYAIDDADYDIKYEKELREQYEECIKLYGLNAKVDASDEGLPF